MGERCALDASEAMWAMNLRVLKHEAETPMRGHDEDGECCRRAKFDLSDAGGRVEP